jgi:hypothetical protein
VCGGWIFRAMDMCVCAGVSVCIEKDIKDTGILSEVYMES